MISPLLANSFLHWFDRAFYGKNGPARWANAKLVRYADDFVVLARYMDQRIVNWIEETLETRFELEINRDKTRIVRLQQPGAEVHFLGYTFRYYDSRWGRNKRYLNMFPSEKAIARACERIKSLTNSSMGYVPVHEMIKRINLYLKGWANYFSIGYPQMAYRKINRYVRHRLVRHLRRRSQRPYSLPKGGTWYMHLLELGLACL